MTNLDPGATLFTPEMSGVIYPDAAKKNKLLKACIERIDYKREAPQRITNPEKKTRKNTRLKGKYAKQNVLPTGAHWTTPPIELDVKLRV